MADKSAVHLSAYTMWRLNWIHPFSDGNGRTSRIFSYILLSVKFGQYIPETMTIPDQIVANRKPYFEALESADKSLGNDWQRRRLSDGDIIIEVIVKPTVKQP
jgi:Fic family protein